jgi:hypothetical protein
LDGGGKARSRNHVAFIGAATLTIFIELDAFAFAQMTVTPGPGGIPIAPGSPVAGYTPGGIGLGGVEVAPGPAARDIPTDRIGPGGVPFPPQAGPLSRQRQFGGETSARLRQHQPLRSAPDPHADDQ